MNRLKWNKACRTGNDEIDSQHRLLFAIANELIEISDPKEEAAEIRYLYRHLNHYVDIHFSEEESLMAEKHFPGLQDHKLKHEAIQNEIGATIKNATDIYDLKDKLNKFMGKWIVDHILSEDMKFKKWLNEGVYDKQPPLARN